MWKMKNVDPTFHTYTIMRRYFKSGVGGENRGFLLFVGLCLCCLSVCYVIILSYWHRRYNVENNYHACLQTTVGARWWICGGFFMEIIQPNICYGYLFPLALKNVFIQRNVSDAQNRINVYIECCQHVLSTAISYQGFPKLIAP